MRSQPHDDLAAIILVGGRSSRMGQPKAWLDVGGRPLLARVVERVLPWIQEIVLVAAPGQTVPALDGVLAGAPPVPVRIVHDDRPGEGPLPALVCGLRATTKAWALALGCDSPSVQSRVVARLAEECRPEVDAVVPTWDGRPQPLVALYRPTLAPTIAALVDGGERRVHALTALPRVCVLSADDLRSADPDGASFRSLNTPEEYAAAVAAWNAERRASSPRR